MRTADAFHRMPHTPDDPSVKASYDALIQEIVAQYDHLTSNGVVMEPWLQSGQPYKNSQEMVADARNKHLWYFPTANPNEQVSFGDDGGDLDPSINPLVAKTGRKVGDFEVRVNDMLRAAHDFCAHSKDGYEFGPEGECNAWAEHAKMFSALAIPALTTETHGQNSWVNFGPHLRRSDGSLPKKGDGDWIPAQNRPFAQQKIGLLPSEVTPPHPYQESLPQSQPKSQQMARKKPGGSDSSLRWQYVRSSWIAAIRRLGNGGVDMRTKKLPTIYRYRGADADTVDSWLDAPSKGKFWHGNIKGIHSPAEKMMRGGDEEESFIRSIQDAPFDAARHAVYSDWLAEHGDDQAASAHQDISQTLSAYANSEQRYKDDVEKHLQYGVGNGIRQYPSRIHTIEGLERGLRDIYFHNEVSDDDFLAHLQAYSKMTAGMAPLREAIKGAKISGPDHDSYAMVPANDGTTAHDAAYVPIYFDNHLTPDKSGGITGNLWLRAGGGARLALDADSGRVTGRMVRTLDLDNKAADRLLSHSIEMLTDRARKQEVTSPDGSRREHGVQRVKDIFKDIKFTDRVRSHLRQSHPDLPTKEESSETPHQMSRRAEKMMRHGEIMDFVRHIDENPEDMARHAAFSDALQDSGNPLHLLVDHHIAHGPAEPSGYDFDAATYAKIPGERFQEQHLSFNPHYDGQHVLVRWVPNNRKAQTADYRVKLPRNQADEIARHFGATINQPEEIATSPHERMSRPRRFAINDPSWHEPWHNAIAEAQRPYQEDTGDEDLAPSLVYADALEENGDFRHKLVRHHVEPPQEWDKEWSLLSGNPFDSSEVQFTVAHSIAGRGLPSDDPRRSMPSSVTMPDGTSISLTGYSMPHDVETGRKASGIGLTWGLNRDARYDVTVPSTKIHEYLDDFDPEVREAILPRLEDAGYRDPRKKRERMSREGHSGSHPADAPAILDAIKGHPGITLDQLWKHYETSPGSSDEMKSIITSLVHHGQIQEFREDAGMGKFTTKLYPINAEVPSRNISRMDKIVEEVNRSNSQSEAAKKLGISRQRVSQAIKEAEKRKLLQRYGVNIRFMEEPRTGNIPVAGSPTPSPVKPIVSSYSPMPREAGKEDYIGGNRSREEQHRAAIKDRLRQRLGLSRHGHSIRFADPAESAPPQRSRVFPFHEFGETTPASFKVDSEVNSRHDMTPLIMHDLKHTFFPGHPDPIRALSSVVGAPSGAHLTVAQYGKWPSRYFGPGEKPDYHGIKVFVQHPLLDGGSLRWVSVDNKTGNKFVYNSLLKYANPGQGIGAEMLARQVENAAKHGFSHIGLHAAGDAKSLRQDPASFNGFLTWPILGFDQSIEPSEYTQEPVFEDAVRRFGAKSIMDLFRTPEGRQFWADHGTDLEDAKFDLSEGSRSMTTLAKYLQEKKAQGKTRWQRNTASTPMNWPTFTNSGTNTALRAGIAGRILSTIRLRRQASPSSPSHSSGPIRNNSPETTKAIFDAHLENPLDRARLGVLADSLDEQGKEHLASVSRTIAEQGKEHGEKWAARLMHDPHGALAAMSDLSGEGTSYGGIHKMITGGVPLVITRLSKRYRHGDLGWLVGIGNDGRGAWLHSTDPRHIHALVQESDSHPHQKSETLRNLL
jgi:uncharacterized protein (TIGR02996 family)